MSALSAPISLGSALTAALDGERLADKVGFTVQLLTFHETGSPHAAFLSVGEVLALSPAELAIALHADSRTTRNVARSPCASLVAVCEGVAFVIRVRCSRPSMVTIAGRDVALVKARITRVEQHDAPYATGLTGISFELREPAATLERWRATIATLREWGGEAVVP